MNSLDDQNTVLFEDEPCLPETVLKGLKTQVQLDLLDIQLSLSQIISEERGVSLEDIQNLLQQTIYNIISVSELFESFTEAELSTISRLAELTARNKGEIVFSEGEQADDLYLIISGRVKVFKSYGNGQFVNLDVLGPGSWFGEMAFLGQNIRSASIKTLQAVGLIRLPYRVLALSFQSNPDFNLGLLKALSERLIQSNLALAHSSSQEEVLKQALTQQSLQMTPTLIGQTQVVTHLMEKLRALGDTTQPVLIQGEPGTELTAAAKYLHTISRGQGSPFLLFTPGQALESFPGPGPAASSRVYEDQHTLEEEQFQRLFGYSPADSPLEEAVRPGLLQIADHGTLVIENLEHLTPQVQHHLAEFIRRGRVLPHGSGAPAYSSVRIAATCHDDPHQLLQQGLLQSRLLNLFYKEVLFLSPLRKRKRDLNLLVDHLIRTSNKLHGTSVQNLEPEAHQRIFSYDWPGNYEELATTIERSVKLAQGATLRSDDLFFGLKPLQGKLSFDLLKCKPIQNIIKNRFYPVLGQSVTAVVLAGLICMGLYGSWTLSNELSLALVWGIWEPLVIVSAFFLARIWCAICPVGGASLIISRGFSLKKDVPLVIRKYGVFLSAAGLMAIFWSQVVWDMYDAARPTAVLLLSITGLGLLSGLLFHKLVWCRYLCPLGALIGLFARSACTEMRSNVHICNHECREHACIESAKHSCPILEAPFTQQSNQNCILCGNCVKTCPNDSPHLNLRVPGYELAVVRYPVGFMNLFVPVLLGCQLFRATSRLDAIPPLAAWSLSWLFWAGLLLFSIATASLFIHISGKRIFGKLLKPDIKKGNLLNYALVPLLLAIELSVQIEFLLLKNFDFLALLGFEYGATWKSLTLSFDPGIIVVYQFLLLAIGALASACLLNAIVKQHQLSQTGLSWKSRWPVVFLAGLFAWLYIAG